MNAGERGHARIPDEPTRSLYGIGEDSRRIVVDEENPAFTPQRFFGGADNGGGLPSFAYRNENVARAAVLPERRDSKVVAIATASPERSQPAAAQMGR